MEILARPSGQEGRGAGSQMWVDEAIWGHRLHDEQSPWLTLLEFLGVLHAEYRRERILVEPSLNGLSYLPLTQLRLRNLLFNNPHMIPVLASGQSDEGMWSSWLARMRENAGGLEDPDFSYLRERFDTFQDFASVIGFLQSSAIEGGSNKRWTSKFVFPFGANALYEDLNVTAKGGIEIDRLFFARTGEVLYLMLCRSSRVDELKQSLRARLLDPSTPYDGLARALQGEVQTARQERSGAYLPCSSHKAFDRLSDDWIALLGLPIPAYDAIPHLVTMTGLNIILYQLERAAEALGRSSRIDLVLEIVSPKRSVVRDLSANSFQDNNALSKQAVEYYIRRIAETTEWKAAILSDDPGANAAELLSREFDWPDPDDDEVRGAAPEKLLEELVDTAQKRHKQHVAKLHGVWGRLIGLSSRRSSRSVRYAPTDRLLKSLVLCCVNDRLEFNDFLALLHERYGMVVGDHQARSLINSGQADQEDFSDNATRLEERLASLGLLKRLSDSCAYVENPFQRTGRP
jgi:hypothetical protein